MSGTYTTVLDAGNQLSYTVTNITAGETYYFAATAYNTQGDESEFSNEVRYTVPFLPGPGNTSTALTVSLGEQTPPMDTLLALSSHTVNLPVLQVRVDIGAEQVSLTTVTVVLSPALDAHTLPDNSAVRLLYDPNGSGNVAHDESVLAITPLRGLGQALTLDLTPPLELPPQTTTYFLLTLGNDRASEGTATTTPGRTGWLLLTPVMFGSVPPWRRRASVWRWLMGILLVCSVAFMSCTNDHDGETQDGTTEDPTLTLTLPAHSVRAEGEISGSLSGPTSPLISPPIVVELP